MKEAEGVNAIRRTGVPGQPPAGTSEQRERETSGLPVIRQLGMNGVFANEDRQ
jgi:hypothetical protein